MAPIFTRLGQAFGFGASTSSAGAASAGAQATGGTTNEYVDSGKTFKTHMFTSSGSLVVEAVGTTHTEFDYLVVGGGGGGSGMAGNFRVL